jgi:hypothetical protein
MIDLKRITSGPLKHEPRVLTYGPGAVGKTTFAAGAPDPFVIDANNGSHKLDVRRMVPADWGECRELISAVEDGKIQCQTLVLDSVTDMEAKSHAHLFGGESIDTWGKGYGRGDTYAIQTWREVLAQLERIWMQGKAIVIVAHSQVKRFDDPTVANGYDRFEVAARKQLAQLLHQWVDYTLFCREGVTPLGKGSENKAVTTGIRYAYTRRCPAFDAKARGTTLFPERVSLSWAEFSKAIHEDATRVSTLTGEINDMLERIKDVALEKEVRAYIKDYPSGISEAHNRLSAILEERVKPVIVEEKIAS